MHRHGGARHSVQAPSPATSFSAAPTVRSVTRTIKQASVSSTDQGGGKRRGMVVSLDPKRCVAPNSG